MELDAKFMEIESMLMMVGDRHRGQLTINPVGDTLTYIKDLTPFHNQPCYILIQATIISLLDWLHSFLTVSLFLPWLYFSLFSAEDTERLLSGGQSKSSFETPQWLSFSLKVKATCYIKQQGAVRPGPHRFSELICHVPCSLCSSHPGLLLITEHPRCTPIPRHFALAVPCAWNALHSRDPHGTLSHCFQKYPQMSSYSFPRAVLTKSHKLSGLQQQKFVLSQFCSLEIWKEIVRRAVL